MKYILLEDINKTIKDYLEEIYPDSDVNEILKTAINILLKYLLDNNLQKEFKSYSGEYVGSGSYGILYRISKDRLFKITTDKGEGIASKRIENKNLEYVAHIYLCEKLDEEIYLIIREYGEPIKLSFKIKEIINRHPVDYDDIKEYLEKYKKYKIIRDIYNGLLELEKYGIKLTDIRDSNVMKFGNKYKITDLGVLTMNISP